MSGKDWTNITWATWLNFCSICAWGRPNMERWDGSRVLLRVSHWTFCGMYMYRFQYRCGSARHKKWNIRSTEGNHCSAGGPAGRAVRICVFSSSTLRPLLRVGSASTWHFRFWPTPATPHKQHNLIILIIMVKIYIHTIYNLYVYIYIQYLYLRTYVCIYSCAQYNMYLDLLAMYKCLCKEKECTNKINHSKE